MPHPSSRKLCTSFMPSALESLPYVRRVAPVLCSVRRVEPRAESLIDLLRIRLAARRLHDLPDEEAEHLRLAVAVLLHLLGICRHDVVDERFDRLAVRDLHEPAALDDLSDVAPFVPQRFEDFLRDLPGNRAVLDPVEQS